MPLKYLYFVIISKSNAACNPILFWPLGYVSTYILVRAVVAKSHPLLCCNVLQPALVSYTLIMQLLQIFFWDPEDYKVFFDYCKEKLGYEEVLRP